MSNSRLEPKPCAQCGRVFEPPNYAMSRKRWESRKYCSHDCAYASSIGRVRSAEHSRNLSKALKGRPNPKVAAALRGRTMPAERRKKISETLKGRTREKNHAWKGDDVGYAARHYRNQKSFQPPADGLCQDCGKPDGGPGRHKRHDWAFLRHPEPHTEMQEDYLYLCRSCHRKRDRAGGF